MSDPLYPRHASADVGQLHIQTARWLTRPVRIVLPVRGGSVFLTPGWVAGPVLAAVFEQHPDALGDPP